LYFAFIQSAALTKAVSFGLQAVTLAMLFIFIFSCRTSRAFIIIFYFPSDSYNVQFNRFRVWPFYSKLAYSVIQL